MGSERTSMGRTISAHAVTVVMTLVLVMVFFGVRLGLKRQTPVVQIPGLSATSPPPLPVQVPDDPDRDVPPVPSPRASTPAPPEDVLKDLDPEERNNVLVYAKVNKSVVNI